MGDPFHCSLLRTPRGRFRVSLPPGGEFLLGTPEPLSRLGAAGQSFCIPISEMVRVQLGGSGSSLTVEGNQFTVFFVQREKHQRWSLGSLEFTVTPGSGLAPRWVDALQCSIQLHGVTRPRKLLVFVNPVGGRCRASEIYRDRVAGLFALAGIQTEVIETQRPHEARDLILQRDLGDLDGLVCVGGDGTFNELMHALISRTQRKAGIPEDNPTAPLLPPRLRIGIIPAGSTDCICFATVGTNDPVTSALHIIIGFKAVLCNRSYEGTVEFLTVGGTEANPRDQTRCRAGCLVCSESNHQCLGDSKEEKLLQQEGNRAVASEWQREQGRFLAINLTCMSSACPKSPDGLSPSAHLADGTADLILVRECSALGFLRHLSRHMDHRDQVCVCGGWRPPGPRKGARARPRGMRRVHKPGVTAMGSAGLGGVVTLSGTSHCEGSHPGPSGSSPQEAPASGEQLPPTVGDGAVPASKAGSLPRPLAQSSTPLPSAV
ncbi:ceramide kinase-like isoform X3 [Gopherus evgoodei]|uniref:ceramide kinase-like isoform X3 n=1 Tax=Gopherus evgoodei TaxID=1825980 RepID=UPI0011CF6C3A|nr:ceramide kinase-like isoform X3 [Gopherus evgoodei]